jgi:hypothetical protein
MTYELKVYTTDDRVHEFTNVNLHVRESVLQVEKYPRSASQEWVSFPLVNVLRWEQK